MPLKPTSIPPVPEETARVARAVFPHGNTLMQLRDRLRTIYTDEAFADLFPTHGQPGSCALASGIGHGLSIHGALDRPAGG
jgi:transposase